MLNSILDKLMDLRHSKSMKKTLKIALFSLSFLSISQAFAENVRVVDPLTEEAVFRDSSAFNRMNKSYSINYIATGFGPLLSGNTGLNLGFFIDRNSKIDLEFTSGRSQNFSYFASDSQVKTNSYGVHYKRFNGNSFYYRAGVDYRYVDYSYTYRNFLNNTTIIEKNDFKGSALTATFVIGNQWQWENFTLGCDWVGIALPFTSQIDSESTTGTNPNPTALRDEEDVFLKKSAGLLLRFYLGVSF